jgi:hypothetical protein
MDSPTAGGNQRPARCSHGWSIVEKMAVQAGGADAFLYSTEFVEAD